MGSYDGAEIWEIFGTYFLSHLSTIVDKIDFGLYRGEGLLVLQNVNGQQIDRVRKNTIQIFKDVGFLIDIKTNLKIVHFLNMTFSLNNGAFKNQRFITVYKKEFKPSATNKKTAT